jgi:hypothetical protein
MRKWNTHLIVVLYAVAASGLPIAAHLSHVESEKGHSHSCADDHAVTQSSPTDSTPNSDPQHDEETCAVCFAYSILKQAADVDLSATLVAELPPPARESVRSVAAPSAARITIIAPRAPPALG